MILPSALLYLVIINLIEILTFASDKARAVAGDWRIPESNLLFLALVGGSPGAFWARQQFRHKTRKQPFSRKLEYIAMVQAGVVFGLGIFWVSG